MIRRPPRSTLTYPPSAYTPRLRAGLVRGPHPGLCALRVLRSCPVAVLLVRRRVDHPGDVARARQAEPDRAFVELRRRIGRCPGGDVVFLGGEYEDRQIDLAQVDRDAAELDPARLDQPVPLVHGLEVEPVHLGRHAGRTGVPVEQGDGEGPT